MIRNALASAAPAQSARMRTHHLTSATLDVFVRPAASA